MTADQVKDALRRRHPAVQTLGRKRVPGVWTTITEWEEIDLVAFSSYKHPPTGAQRKAHYPRVGYEVKVSRADMRRELLRPTKRLRARGLCHEFYFAVPAGMLTDQELAYREPAWQAGDFQRQECTAGCVPMRHMVFAPDEHRMGPRVHVLRPPQGISTLDWDFAAAGPCPSCQGRGYLRKSRVELEAPTLWIPEDVGLICVGESGRATVVKKSPVSLQVTPIDGMLLGGLARWLSARPDPRHASLT